MTKLESAAKLPPREPGKVSLPAEPPKPHRAPRSDKGAPRQPPNAVDIIRKRQQWVTERLAKLTPEYEALKREADRNAIALNALEVQT
jgi:hypothetical protein